ncbi:MAG: hypothetical protein KC766_41945 [Myxococcales bacterium]|nr:hypothetical protein [Myxococcales bacterium]
MSQRSLRLACLAAVFGCAAYPGVSLGQGGEEATAPGEGEGPAAGAGPEDTQDAGATPRPAADPPTRTAPLVVAGPGEEQSPPAVAKGQAGQELHDAHYRVKKETDVLTVRRKRKTGVKPPDDLRAGLSLAAGSVATPGIDQGWYGRLDFTTLAGKRKGLFGGVIGADAGFEYWTSTGGSGGGIPIAVGFGALGPLSHFGIDLGFEFLIDDRDDDLGFGIYAPFARGKLGFDFGSVMILADSQIQYRWQWGADDYTDYRLGLNIRLLGEQDPPPPRPRAQRQRTGD